VDKALDTIANGAPLSIQQVRRGMGAEIARYNTMTPLMLDVMADHGLSGFIAPLKTALVRAYK
jgi:hypothetical protein